MAGRHSSEGILTKQSKIAALAGIEPRQVLTTLAHQIDIDWLREEYRRTRKDGATTNSELIDCCQAHYANSLQRVDGLERYRELLESLEADH